MTNSEKDHIKRLKEEKKQEDFEFEVRCMLLEEREWNRDRMREYGYRLGVQTI